MTASAKKIIVSWIIFIPLCITALWILFEISVTALDYLYGILVPSDITDTITTPIDEVRS